MLGQEYDTIIWWHIYKCHRLQNNSMSPCKVSIYVNNMLTCPLLILAENGKFHPLTLVSDSIYVRGKMNINMRDTNAAKIIMST